MRDTLVVAISQSGTTTDTNRTVDLVRGRGAAVVAIVNRRNSDLVDKSDGVLYTSDGRDVEMSVASTKAFYAQIAAGFLLALAIADARPARLDERDRRARAARRRCVSCPTPWLRSSPGAPAIAASRSASAPHPPVLGGRRQRRRTAIAAQELRIKLSELCYKSIACDVTEDKKHIDLSSEPLILVCAAGLTGSNADDVAKEVAIYRAHQAAPIVIATDRRRAVHGRARDDHRPATCTPRSASCSRPWPGTCSATRPRSRSTRPRGRCARRAPRSRPSSRPRRDADACSTGSRRGSSRRRAGSSTGSAAARTTAPRGEHRRAAASLLRYAIGVVPLDVVRARVRQGRHAERRRRGPHRARSRGDRAS